jgi:hypothetical protein
MPRLLLVLLLPCLLGLDGSSARRALERAFHNLYAPDQLAGVELEILSPERVETRLTFAYGRQTSDAGTRTLVYTGDGRRDSRRVLLFQAPGESDRVFVAEGRDKRVRPLSAGGSGWRFFGSDFSYEDFRTHRADEYRIEELGEDRIDGEPCRVLRLWPDAGPYRMMLVWLSTERPIIVRSDHFDDRGLWKRYRVKLDRVVEDFEWWVPLEDEMLDLRTGSRTVRRIRNILVDVAVPDELFSVARLARGHLPSF